MDDKSIQVYDLTVSKAFEGQNIEADLLNQVINKARELYKTRVCVNFLGFGKFATGFSREQERLKRQFCSDLAATHAGIASVKSTKHYSDDEGLVETSFELKYSTADNLKYVFSFIKI